MAVAAASERKHRFGWAFPLICCLPAVAACGNQGLILPEDGEPASLVILEGDGQVDTVGQVLRDSLVVRITDRGNRPITQQEVRFLAPPSLTGARAIPATAQTDADGRARVRWVLGTIPGPQSLQARVTGPKGELTADFHAAAVVAAAETIFAVSGDSQIGVVASDLGQPLVAVVTDRYGNPVSGITATWKAVGGGSTSPTTSISGSNGQVTARRTLGSTPGSQQTVLTAPGLKGSPLVFVHIVTQGLPSSLIAESGNNQSGVPGQPLANPIVVRLTDALGNGIGGRAVTWPVVTGGGTITSASTTTDVTGRASARWTLGPLAGANIVVSSSSGFTATFTASGNPTQPTTISANSPIQSSGAAGGAASPAPSVRVTDAQGRPVTGVVVTFAVTGGGGSVVPSTTATDATGTATVALWTLGTQTGTNTLSASASGASGALSGSPVRFTASAAAGTSSRLAITTQPSSAAVSGVPLTQPPSVQLQDANGNDVGGSGVVVTATLAGSPAGASLSSAIATTDVGGTATFTGLTLTAPAASYTLLFTAPGLTAVTSNPVDLQGGTTPQSISVLVQPSASIVNGGTFAVQPAALVVDQNSIPVSGASVTASVASGGGLLGGQSTISTDALGIATFSNLSLTGTVGSYTLRLSAGGPSVVTTAISLTPGSASASQTTANVPSRGNAGRRTVISVQTRDQSGNDLSTGGHTVVITVTGKNPAGPLVAADNGDGSYTASYTPSRKGNDVIAITLDGVPIAGSPYPSDVH